MAFEPPVGPAGPAPGNPHEKTQVFSIDVYITRITMVAILYPAPGVGEGFNWGIWTGSAVPDTPGNQYLAQQYEHATVTEYPTRDVDFGVNYFYLPAGTPHYLYINAIGAGCSYGGLVFIYFALERPH